MGTVTELSLIAVLVLAVLHLLAGYAHRGAIERPMWLAAAGGLSVAYVFAHLLPELAETQTRYLEARPERTLVWLESHVYLAALVGVILALAADRLTRGGGRARFWVHTGSFALYNLLIGGFAMRLVGVVPTILAVIAFGAHFLVNDHALQVRHGRAYTRYGRWVLAAAIVLGWGIATVSRPSVTLVAALLGVLSGGIILNVLKDEIPERREGHFVAFVAGAISYAALLVALSYSTATA